MIETAIRETIQQEALKKIQNNVRNAKNIVIKYLNDYVNGEYDLFVTLGSTAEILQAIGGNINQHIETIEKA